jgi:branched-chain amino acid transport system ATP-binding protein
MPERALLSIENMTVRYGEAQALSNVSLTVAQGGITSIVGANGAGKTTLIRAIAGMVPIAGGRIRFRDQGIEKLSSADICELGIGQVPEGRQIFPSLSVEDNLKAGSLLRHARRARKQKFDQVYEMFPKLRERHRQSAGTLSGGEQQMLAIARCLMSDPQFIMLDEPSLGLSPLLTEVMFGIVRDLARSDLTVLLVEQNVVESLTLSSTAYVLENGSVVMHGNAADLLEDDRIRSAYLGL